jgi:hypothetical protein
VLLEVAHGFTFVLLTSEVPHWQMTGQYRPRAGPQSGHLRTLGSPVMVVVRPGPGPGRSRRLLSQIVVGNRDCRTILQVTKFIIRAVPRPAASPTPARADAAAVPMREGAAGADAARCPRPPALVRSRSPATTAPVAGETTDSEPGATLTEAASDSDAATAARDRPAGKCAAAAKGPARYQHARGSRPSGGTSRRHARMSRGRHIMTQTRRNPARYQVPRRCVCAATACPDVASCQQRFTCSGTNEAQKPVKSVPYRRCADSVGASPTAATQRPVCGRRSRTSAQSGCETGWNRITWQSLWKFRVPSAGSCDMLGAMRRHKDLSFTECGVFSALHRPAPLSAAKGSPPPSRPRARDRSQGHTRPDTNSAAHPGCRGLWLVKRQAAPEQLCVGRSRHTRTPQLTRCRVASKPDGSRLLQGACEPARSMFPLRARATRVRGMPRPFRACKGTPIAA